MCFPVVLAALLLSSTTPGEFNEVLSIGDRAPAWQALPGIDGQSHTMDKWKGKRLLLIVFTCNSCPCARDYEDRIKAVASKYGEQLGVVAINSNIIPEDRLEAMKKRARDRGFNFSYLFDESQSVAKAYGALYTPEFFLLNQERKVVYMGAMDDKDDPDKVTKKYLSDAIDAVLAGKEPGKAETRARGCLIRYKKMRK